MPLFVGLRYIRRMKVISLQSEGNGNSFYVETPKVRLPEVSGGNTTTTILIELPVADEAICNGFSSCADVFDIQRATCPTS